MAMPAAVAAQTNSMSAVNTTRLSFAANLARSTGASSIEPNGTILSMLAAEQAMKSTPTAIAFPLYEGISISFVCWLWCRAGFKAIDRDQRHA